MDWMPHFDLIELQKFFLAKTSSLSASPSSTSEIELLKSQLEFLKQTYAQFVDAMKIIFIVLGIGGGVAAYFFGKNFKDFQAFIRQDIEKFQEYSRKEVQDAVQRVRQDAEAQIPRLVETELGVMVRAEVASLRQTLRREQVIGLTLVDYYLPNGTDEPKEVDLLRARNFKNVQFCNSIKALQDIQSLRRSSSEVVVLDLINFVTSLGETFPDLVEQNRETEAKTQIDALLEFLPTSTVLIVYVSTPPQLKYLNSIPKTRYVIPANNPITLIGNATDGAYVAVGDHRIRDVSI